jgi:hypothetical protein
MKNSVLMGVTSSQNVAKIRVPGTFSQLMGTFSYFYGTFSKR